MKGWGSLSRVNMKFQVESHNLFPTLYLVSLDNTVKLSIGRIRDFPLCEFLSLFFYVEKTYIHVYMCFYITMCGITKFMMFSVFRYQDIVSKVCRAHKKNASWPLYYFSSNCFCSLFLFVCSQMRCSATFLHTFVRYLYLFLPLLPTQRAV